MKKIIYDLGSNNGDDIPYYLKKGDVVIAVEANPVLCEQIRNRFKGEIDGGRLFVESCVLTADEMKEDVYFYLHRFDSVVSQFPQPIDPENYEKVLLPSKSILQLISLYGDPYYIKIDIERYDAAILRSLFENKIMPPFISAESHTIEVFSLLVAMGRYNSFKLVEGCSVSEKYKNHKIISNEGAEVYSFPHHSAGPFGEDISGKWMTADTFYRLLAFECLGWKDVHATSMFPADARLLINPLSYIKSALREGLRYSLPERIKKIIRITRSYLEIKPNTRN